MKEEKDMKQRCRKISKLSLALGLIVSLFANSMSNLLAVSEKQEQENISQEKPVIEDEKEKEVKEEVEKETEPQIQPIQVEQEIALTEAKQTVSYQLSKNRFRSVYTKIMAMEGATVTFTNEPVPAGVTTTDMTDARDQSVVSYQIDNRLVVTTNGVKAKIKFPVYSDYLFWHDDPKTTNEVVAIDFSNVDTSQVVTFQEMFAYCKKLTHLDLSTFDTSRLENMYRMFFACESLVSIDVTSFNTENVTSMNGVFEYCVSLTTVDVSGFRTENVTNMRQMFKGCRKLATIDTSNFKTPKLDDLDYMFYDCKSVTELDLSGFNTSKVTSMFEIFADCESLVRLDLSNFDTSNVVDYLYSLFDGCTSLQYLDISNFNTSKITNMNSLFSGCSSLINLNVSNFDTSNVTDMGYMFEGCKSLVQLDISNFDTSKVRDMRAMFSNCTSLTNLDVSNFDTSNVTNMRYMFNNCTSLTNLDVSNFNTSNVTDMVRMFYYCTSLSNLNLSNFNTSNVTNMATMFYNCNSLTSLNVSSFDTSNVINMSYMFAYCTSLPTLYVDNFKTDNVTTMLEMFKNCRSLTTLYANVWNIDNVVEDTDMFLECPKLVGVSASGQKVPYDVNRIGKVMATSEGGYFTYPQRADWTITVNYVDPNNKIVGSKNFLVSNQQPIIAAKDVQNDIPMGYEAVHPLRDLVATQDNQVFEVPVQEVSWTVHVEYQTEDGSVVKTEPVQVTQINPIVSAQVIANGVPTGYEFVHSINDFTATTNGDKCVVVVREILWTVTVNFVTVDARGLIATASFQVGNLHPLLKAQQIIAALPEGYQAVHEIQDRKVNHDGEVFEIIVEEKVGSLEGIVHFVDQKGTIVKTQVYTVAQNNPIIQVTALEEALPYGATPVNPLTELTVTKDKEEFIIHVIMSNYEEVTPVPGNKPEGSIDGVQTGDTTQVGWWMMVMGVSLGVCLYERGKQKKLHR